MQRGKCHGQSRLKAHVMLSPSAWLRVNPAEASKLLPASIVQGPTPGFFVTILDPSASSVRVTVMLGVTVILLSNLGSIGGSLRRDCPGKCHGLFLQAPLPEGEGTFFYFRTILTRFEPFLVLVGWGSFDRLRMSGTKIAQG